MSLILDDSVVIYRYFVVSRRDSLMQLHVLARSHDAAAAAAAAAVALFT